MVFQVSLVNGVSGRARSALQEFEIGGLTCKYGLNTRSLSVRRADASPIVARASEGWSVPHERNGNAGGRAGLGVGWQK